MPCRTGLQMTGHDHLCGSVFPIRLKSVIVSCDYIRHLKARSFGHFRCGDDHAENQSFSKNVVADFRYRKTARRFLDNKYVIIFLDMSSFRSNAKKAKKMRDIKDLRQRSSLIMQSGCQKNQDRDQNFFALEQVFTLLWPEIRELLHFPTDSHAKLLAFQKKARALYNTRKKCL